MGLHSDVLPVTISPSLVLHSQATRTSKDTRHKSTTSNSSLCLSIHQHVHWEDPRRSDSEILAMFRCLPLACLTQDMAGKSLARVCMSVYIVNPYVFHDPRTSNANNGNINAPTSPRRPRKLSHTGMPVHPDQPNCHVLPA